MWFPNRSDTNRPVQAQKRARSLKFRIKVEEELYCPRIENKGADQLLGYCEADLCLCFRLCRLLVFPCGSSFLSHLLIAGCDIGVQISVRPFVRSSVRPSTFTSKFGFLYISDS